MGKAKTKTKKSSTKKKGPSTYGKVSKVVEKKPNPFDLRYSRQKKTTPVSQKPANGLKKGSFVSGTPSVAKSKSIEKRKIVMTQLLGDAAKSNKFEDKRIGAGPNGSVVSKFGPNFEKQTLEDMIFQKMSLERRTEGKKVRRGNAKFLEANRDDDDEDGYGKGGLGDSVELTHLGQSIAEIERFERPVTDFAGDEDDDQEETLFTQALTNDDKQTSLKDRMAKLIEVSRLNRAINKEANDRLKEQTESLDLDWKTVVQLLPTATVVTNLQKSDKEKEVDRAYGNLMEACDGTARAVPVDPEPDPEEQESQNHLENENDGIDVSALRSLMSQDVARNPHLKPVPAGHQSADDLGDIFTTSVKNLKRESKIMFQYTKEGKLIVPDEMKEKAILRRVRTNRRLSEEEDEDDDDVASVGELDVIEDSEIDDSENEDEAESGSGEDSDNGDEDVVIDDDDIMDGDDVINETDENEVSDLESLDEHEYDSEFEQDTENVENGKNTNHENGDSGDGANDASKSLSKATTEFTTDLFQNEFADFFKHLWTLFSEDRPKMEDYLKKLLETLFPRTDYKKTCRLLLNHLLKSVDEHLDSLDASQKMDIQFMSVLFTTIKNICQKNVEVSNSLVRQVLLRKFEEIKTTSALSLNLFVFLAFVKNVYSFRKYTQDVLHTMMSMTLSKVLTKCRVCTISDLRTYLLFIDLFLQITPNFTEVIKSPAFYVPEVIVGLQNVLNLALQVDKEQPIQIEIKIGFLVSGLHFSGKAKYDWTELISSGMQMKQTPRTRFKLLAFASNILLKFVDKWKTLHSCSEVMKGLQETVKMLVDSSGVSNELLLKQFNSFLDSYSSLKEVEREELKLVAPKPKPFAQLNPKMLEVLDENLLKGSAFGKQNEKRRKQRQLRRETRGAMKEVMKDSMFVQRTWLNEQIAKDRERKQKVKNIYSQLANQEGEVKKLKKTKYQLI